MGEQQQAAAASHQELSRPHVHGEAEDGSAAAEGPQFRPWVSLQVSLGRKSVLVDDLCDPALRNRAGRPSARSRSSEKLPPWVIFFSLFSYFSEIAMHVELYRL